jgi:hypothetical protein
MSAIYLVPADDIVIRYLKAFVKQFLHFEQYFSKIDFCEPVEMLLPTSSSSKLNTASATCVKVVIVNNLGIDNAGLPLATRHTRHG